AAPGAALTLDKRLPVAGGIGGGSADAAAALLALRALWRLDIADERLAEIGLALGADIPVCLASRPARMAGIGERLTPLPSLLSPGPPLGLLLVNPGVAVPTARVFAELNGRFTAPGEALAVAPDAQPDRAALLEVLRRGRNDLEAPALRVAPVIGEVLTALAALPGARLARMSGSGATCFALFDDAGAAQAAARRLGDARADWWRAAGHLIGARPEIGL
ncbi:MAG: 4-(cytidine 5'-diphospho)-2-C-methyl-D-erythritol kinase, partial [Alphaproteobacteria bacterium]